MDSVVADCAERVLLNDSAAVDRFSSVARLVVGDGRKIENEQNDRLGGTLHQEVVPQLASAAEKSK